MPFLVTWAFFKETLEIQLCKILKKWRLHHPRCQIYLLSQTCDFDSCKIKWPSVVFDQYNTCWHLMFGFLQSFFSGILILTPSACSSFGDARNMTVLDACVLWFFLGSHGANGGLHGHGCTKGEGRRACAWCGGGRESMGAVETRRDNWSGSFDRGYTACNYWSYAPNSSERLEN